MVAYDPEKLKDRAENLGALNGMRSIVVDLIPGSDPAAAKLDLRLWNTNNSKQIRDAAAADVRVARRTFPISGGSRLPAGPGAGQVRVMSVEPAPPGETDGPTVIHLTVSPVGDYTTYTLRLVANGIDPIFGSIPFRFRPGCFTTDCDPPWCATDEAEPTPAIDYLARDYDSFKHTLIAAMMERVPGWRPTSEADLDETLIELLSARADELADFQDRAIGEAYLATARGRVSLARHARLMDYHFHQGNQASTWLVLSVGAGVDIAAPKDLSAWTPRVPDPVLSHPFEIGARDPDLDRQVFIVTDAGRLNGLLDRIRIHTWSETLRELPKDATEADLLLDSVTKADVDRIRLLINRGDVRHLVIEEVRDPATCKPTGFDRERRQLLTLRRGAAASVVDPILRDPNDPSSVSWLLHVAWREPLEHDYCITATCTGETGGTVDDVSVLRGNVVRAVHGRPVTTWFLPPGSEIDPDDPERERKHLYDGAREDCRDLDDPCRPGVGGRPYGVTLQLPAEDGPLLYRATPTGGEVPPCSTLTVRVNGEVWTECPNLVHSRPDDVHYVVDTDEHVLSSIRFGNGTNGRGLPDGATVVCDYQVGSPLDGNVGADAIKELRTVPVALAGATVRNPFDVRDAQGPEPYGEIIRRVPEAYRARQLRAVTLGDYARRAGEVDGVARAAARYAWTGSWRTVQVTVDAVGGALEPETRDAVLRHLDAVRLIGEDLEIREPRFAPLDIDVVVCVRADHWIHDVRGELLQAFSVAIDRDGRKAFFHPDRWTFGQELHASQIAARIDAMEGIDHVVSIRMKRFDTKAPATDVIAAVQANEIIQVRNDPDRREAGTISFQFQGGRT
jgi:hypothetical protein